MKKGAALAALLVASCDFSSRPPEIAVEQAWARATVPGQTTAAVYFMIENRGGEDRLVDVSSPIGRASIHSSSMDGGVMRMRPLGFVTIAADSTVALEPGGTHVMLTGIRQALTAGSDFPLLLTFERSGQKRVRVVVRALSAGGGAM